MPDPFIFLDKWTTWTRLTGNADDDWADRLNHIVTVVLLIAFSVFVVGGSYMDERIACWMPGEYTAHMAKYTVNYCWVQNTYFIPMEENVPKGNNREHELTYYQYVPMILLFSALLFKLPSVVWRAFSGFSGVDIRKLVEMTAEAHYVDDAKRDAKIEEIVCTIDRWLEGNRQYHWNCLVRMRQKLSRLCFCLNRREGTYLTGLYLISKLMFCVNVICQFYILDAFLGGFYSYWGIEAIRTLAVEHQLKESRRFPRVSLCSFSVRGIQQKDHTVQCVLPLNLFNEKIFLFLWFWFVFVAISTGANLMSWIWHLIVRRNRVSFVKKYLKIKGRLQTTTDKSLCTKFGNYLRDDGIFLLQLLARNSNPLHVTDVINGLWDRFLEKPISKKVLADLRPPNLQNNNKGDNKASYI
ncbi:innexin unc-9-like [Mya arenaria]|uniref:innexin unc-9-like n=1 Tax=Mya arenaria TaxID=6604 RepID=UPI0022DFA6E0|nr:innexin unc-9-like [Mya arenaria]